MDQWTVFEEPGLSEEEPFFFGPDPKYLGLQNSLIVLARGSANEAGLELEGFYTDETFELYYRVNRNFEYCCHLSKGWNDSGFIVSDSRGLLKESRSYKKRLATVSRICSKYRLVQSVSRRSDETFHGIIFQARIHTDELNGKALKEAVRNLEGAMEEVRKVLYPF